VKCIYNIYIYYIHQNEPSSNLIYYLYISGSQNSAVSRVTQATDNPGGCKRCFSSAKCPDWLWAHPAFYEIDIEGAFPKGKVVRARG
jgi:hypothetical protein